VTESTLHQGLIRKGDEHKGCKDLLLFDLFRVEFLDGNVNQEREMSLHVSAHLPTAHFTQGRKVEIFCRRAKADDATLHRVFKWE